MFTTLDTATILDHRTSQIHFYNTRTVLFSSAVAVAVLPMIVPAVRRHSRYRHTVILREQNSRTLAVHLACMPLHALLEYSTPLWPLPFQSMYVYYGKVCLSPSRSERDGTEDSLVFFTSEASRVTVLLGATAFRYRCICS
jgi:hypothetical protein